LERICGGLLCSPDDVVFRHWRIWPVTDRAPWRELIRDASQYAPIWYMLLMPDDAVLEIK